MSDSLTSNEQLVTYLEVCANLAEERGSDGLAYVSPVELRKVIALIRPAHETTLSEPVGDYVLVSDMVEGSHSEFGQGLFVTRDAIRHGKETVACTCPGGRPDTALGRHNACQIHGLDAQSGS
jgi:hypothetical protein